MSELFNNFSSVNPSNLSNLFNQLGISHNHKARTEYEATNSALAKTFLDKGLTVDEVKMVWFKMFYGTSPDPKSALRLICSWIEENRGGDKDDANYIKMMALASRCIEILFEIVSDEDAPVEEAWHPLGLRLDDHDFYKTDRAAEIYSALNYAKRMILDSPSESDSELSNEDYLNKLAEHAESAKIGNLHYYNGYFMSSNECAIKYHKDLIYRLNKMITDTFNSAYEWIKENCKTADEIRYGHNVVLCAEFMDLGWDIDHLITERKFFTTGIKNLINSTTSKKPINWEDTLDDFRFRVGQ